MSLFLQKKKFKRTVPVFINSWQRFNELLDKKVCRLVETRQLSCLLVCLNQIVCHWIEENIFHFTIMDEGHAEYKVIDNYLLWKLYFAACIDGYAFIRNYLMPLIQTTVASSTSKKWLIIFTLSVMMKLMKRKFEEYFPNWMFLVIGQLTFGNLRFAI